MVNGILFEPHSKWRCPREFPNLDSAKLLGFDIESRDPDLHTRGPGFISGNAAVVGVSVGTVDRGWYFPISNSGGEGVDRDALRKWLIATFDRPDLYIVGAHVQYDIEGLWSFGVNIPGMRSRVLDIQIAEALIDEEREDGYDLGTLTTQYLGEGKDEALLNEAAQAYGIDPKKDLWRLPSKFVGPYAEFDAMSCAQVLQKQLEILKRDDLLPIFEMESKLIPILWEMRRRGVRMDTDKAKLLTHKLLLQEDLLRERCRKEYSVKVDEWSSPQLARICDDLKIHYPLTAKGNPSFEGEWLENHDHPFLKLVSEIRELNRLRTTFIDKWVFGNLIKGRVHPQWKQLKRDDGGTRTGRMAASNPNPQQVPSRSDIAPLIRELFIPDEGFKWAKLDYSQQEPRILVHFAALCKLTSVELIRMAYQENKAMDFYKFLTEAAHISRREAKDMSLGRMYGMGVKTMAGKLNCSQDEAKKRLDEFDSYVPFVKEISEKCSKLAQARGWIKTLCGRKRHFNLWEPIDCFDRRKKHEDVRPLSRELALRKWGNRLQRAGTHKALNSLIQGSAADMTKMAMLQVYETTGDVPYLQVHDELDYPVRDREHAEQLQKITEECVELQVPIRADLSYGDHWK